MIMLPKVYHCERLDKNKDELLHADDLRNVLWDTLGPDTITQRELKYLTESISLPRKRDTVEYKKMSDLLSFRSDSHERPEHWNGDDDDALPVIHKGSIGEFLVKAACISEQKNYSRLMKALARFEKDSGMRVDITPSGLVIPLGPDLQATMQISLRS